MVRWLALMLSAVMPVVHSFAAYGVAHRPAALRVSRPPQAVALPLQGSSQPPIEVLYDGQCMVCLSNKAILSFFDFRKQKRINFVNIRDKGYEPSAHGGVLYEDAMRHLHVVDGSSVTTGSEAVLLAYSKVGLGWLMNVLRLPLIRWCIDALYSFVSKHRMTISRYLPGGKALTEGVSQLKDVQSASDGLGCEDEEECMLDYDDDDE